MEGFWGWAWVWLRLVRAGLIPGSARRQAAIYRALQRELDGDPRNEVSVVRGVGVFPVVIALAAPLDKEFGALLPRAFALWTRSLERSTKIDAYAGAAGVILAAAEIKACLPKQVPRSLVELAHQRLVDGVRAALLPNVPRPALGFAHGFAGNLLALEMARAVFGLATPAKLLRQALETLEDTRREAPDGAAFWPYAAEDDEIQLHAWCNGSPGIALALLGCHRIGMPGLRPRYRDLALRALRATTYEVRAGGSSFCCGAIGRAQILIEAYRELGEPEWARAASRIARKIAWDNIKGRHFRNGTLGAIYLRWRLAHPAVLPFPAFGSAVPAGTAGTFNDSPE